MTDVTADSIQLSTVGALSHKPREGIICDNVLAHPSQDTDVVVLDVFNTGFVVMTFNDGVSPAFDSTNSTDVS
jgi:hypothetical protein